MTSDDRIVILRAREHARCGLRCRTTPPPYHVEVAVHRTWRLLDVTFGPGLALSPAGQTRGTDLLAAYQLSGWLAPSQSHIAPRGLQLSLGPGSGTVSLDQITEAITSDLCALVRAHVVAVERGR